MLNGTMNVAAVARLRKLRRAEYDRLVEMGWFQDERVELIDGLLVEMGPQGTRHAEVVARLNRLLMAVLLDRATVRIRSPFAIGDAAEPEPDVAVVPLADYSGRYPETAFLIIEVAESSLAKDRLVKAELYARGGVPEYWLVDLDGRAVEVYRDPRDGVYRSMTRLSEADTLKPQAFEDLSIAVATLLLTGTPRGHFIAKRIVHGRQS
jgi:Uma2 family endonuclease